jgi:hypothetical protein
VQHRRSHICGPSVRAGVHAAERKADAEGRLRRPFSCGVARGEATTRSCSRLPGGGEHRDNPNFTLVDMRRTTVPKTRGNFPNGSTPAALNIGSPALAPLPKGPPCVTLG